MSKRGTVNNCSSGSEVHRVRANRAEWRRRRYATHEWRWQEKRKAQGYVRTWTKSSSSPRSMFALWILCRFFRILTDGVQWYGEWRKAGKYAKSQRCKVSISCIHYSSSSSNYQTRSLSFHFACLISLVTRHIPQGEGNKTKKPRYLARPHIYYGTFSKCSLKTEQAMKRKAQGYVRTWTKSSSSPRSISIDQLHALLHFHLRPIKLVVYKWPYFLKGMWYLILRCASRLDAFSVYHIRTRLPGYALGRTTDAPEVRPTRSSRTKVSSSQISNAHDR